MPDLRKIGLFLKPYTRRPLYLIAISSCLDHLTGQGHRARGGGERTKGESPPGNPPRAPPPSPVLSGLLHMLKQEQGRGGVGGAKKRAS